MNYLDDDLHVDKENKSCQTIDGPGEGKPCIFPFTFYDKVYLSCTTDGFGDTHMRLYWCSTMVDENGKHVAGKWGACSLGCPGTKQEGYIRNKCDTEEQGIQCNLPFSFMGHSYFGCIKRPWQDKYWCVVKDAMAQKGFARKNCSESCPTDTVISEVKLSPKEIVEKLKTNPKVYSMIERDGDCKRYLASYDMPKVEQRKENIFTF